MMFHLFTVEVVSYTAAWLSFVGFIVGLYECWRYPPLRLFFGMMLVCYSAIYGIDIAHGKNPLILVAPPGAAQQVYWWAPITRQMFARLIICSSTWSLLYAYKTHIPSEENDAQNQIL